MRQRNIDTHVCMKNYISKLMDTCKWILHWISVNTKLSVNY